MPRSLLTLRLPLLLASLASCAPSTSPAARGPTRSADVPVVLGPSNERCGAALLSALLQGYGKEASVESLMPRLDIDARGASIDAMEDTANALGLPVEQIMVPPELAFQALDQHLPAIVVRQVGDKQCFDLLWEREPGDQIELLDCEAGRQLRPAAQVERELYLHELEVDAAAATAWLHDDAFVRPLERLLLARGLPAAEATALTQAARQDPGWMPMARLDASVRAAARLGQDPAALIQRAALEGPAAAGLIDADWTVRQSPTPEQVVLRGAVFLRVIPN